MNFKETIYSLDICAIKQTVNYLHSQGLRDHALFVWNASWIYFCLLHACIQFWFLHWFLIMMYNCITKFLDFEILSWAQKKNYRYWLVFFCIPVFVLFDIRKPWLSSEKPKKRYMDIELPLSHWPSVTILKYYEFTVVFV